MHLDTADAKRVAALVARATNFAHPILGAVHIACSGGPSSERHAADLEGGRR